MGMTDIPRQQPDFNPDEMSMGEKPENSMAQTAKTAQAAISQKVEKIGERANQLGNRMSRNVDKAMDATAVGLERTSSRISQMATYFRDHNTSDLMGSLETTIRKYPARSVLVGVLAGFMLSGMLRSK